MSAASVGSLPSVRRSCALRQQKGTAASPARIVQGSTACAHKSTAHSSRLWEAARPAGLVRIIRTPGPEAQRVSAGSRGSDALGAGMPANQFGSTSTSTDVRPAVPAAPVPSLTEQAPAGYVASSKKLELDLEPDPFDRSFAARANVRAGGASAPPGILSGMSPSGLTPLLSAALKTPCGTGSPRPTLGSLSAVGAWPNCSFSFPPVTTSTGSPALPWLPPSNVEILVFSPGPQQPAVSATAATAVGRLPASGSQFASTDIQFRSPRFLANDDVAEDETSVLPDSSSGSLPSHMISRPLYDVSMSQSLPISPSILLGAASLEDVSLGISAAETFQSLPPSVGSTKLPTHVSKGVPVSASAALQASPELALSALPEEAESVAISAEHGSLIASVSASAALQASPELALSVSPEGAGSVAISAEHGSLIASMAPELSADIVSSRKRKRKTESLREESPSPGQRAHRLLNHGAANGCGAANCSGARWRGADVPASSSPSSSSTSSNGKSAKGRRLRSPGEGTETSRDDVHVEDDTPPPSRTKGRSGAYISASGRENSTPVTEEKRRSLLERNRRAALKCRQRKKQWQQTLQETAEKLTDENEQLQEQATKLREDILNLKALLIAQKDCPVAKANGVVDGNVINGTGALPQFPIFPPVTVVRSTPSRRS